MACEGWPANTRAIPAAHHRRARRVRRRRSRFDTLRRPAQANRPSLRQTRLSTFRSDGALPEGAPLRTSSHRRWCSQGYGSGRARRDGESAPMGARGGRPTPARRSLTPRLSQPGVSRQGEICQPGVKRIGPNEPVVGVMRGLFRSRNPCIKADLLASARTTRTTQTWLITRRSRVRIPPPLLTHSPPLQKPPEFETSEQSGVFLMDGRPV